MQNASPFSAHDLLRLADAAALTSVAPRPGWVDAAIGAAPWVVVRRVAHEGGLIPVGVRGATRDKRWAASLAPQKVEDVSPPESLLNRRTDLTRERLMSSPALAALDPLEAILRRYGLTWGPTGSVGFELASGVATATPTSDLDVVVRCAQRLSRAVACDLAQEVAALRVRCDLMLETPAGGVALLEYARVQGPVAARGQGGPRLVDDPWVPGRVGI